ncbi:MAG TPA: hypothetical protein VOB72_23725, partial [Candidatus Dormibacteraeota bacterium]|nr:hypothetical protein [Candidatus Dormibacteraeota bacterium]
MVAEGIEQEVQVRTLGEMQLELGQGYYFSVPLTSDEMETVLEGDGILAPRQIVWAASAPTSGSPGRS